eukprot:10760067-Alexandrium_andersonii.AAC.1
MCVLLSCRHRPTRKPDFEPRCYADNRFRLARHGLPLGQRGAPGLPVHAEAHRPGPASAPSPR